MLVCTMVTYFPISTIHFDDTAAHPMPRHDMLSNNLFYILVTSGIMCITLWTAIMLSLRPYYNIYIIAKTKMSHDSLQQPFIFSVVFMLKC